MKIWVKNGFNYIKIITFNMKNLSKLVTRTLAVLVVLSVYFWLIQSSFWLLNKASTIANIIGLLGLGVMTVIGLVAIYNFISYIKGKL